MMATLTDTFTFGKYKGQVIGAVMKTNAGYIVWANENISYFSLSKEDLEVVYGFVKQQRDEYYAKKTDYHNRRIASRDKKKLLDSGFDQEPMTEFDCDMGGFGRMFE